MPSMRRRFLSNLSTLEHLNFLQSDESIRHYHRIRRQQLRAEMKRLQATIDGPQPQQAISNADQHEVIVFAGSQFHHHFVSFNLPPRAITI